MNDEFGSACTLHACELAHCQQLRAQRRRAARLRRKRNSACTASARADPADQGQSPTQRRGSRYERAALEHLQNAGLAPLAANLRCPRGEIDLVMRDGATLVFVEVRARANAGYGGAAASVTPRKQARVTRAAALLLPMLCARFFAGRKPRCRFDVVAFEGNTLFWLRGAFGDSGR